MNQENKPLIKRTGSLIEITLGDRKAEGLKTDSREEVSCLKCCFTPLSKLQLCILAIIAIAILILALFVIIILVGVIASHEQRLRDLEIKTEILDITNTHLLIPAKNLANNETEFQREMRETINGVINKYNTIFFETISGFSRRDQLENKVDQLVNQTARIDEQLDLLSTQIQEQQLVKNTVETQSNSLTIENDQSDQVDKEDHGDSSDQLQVPEDQCNCDKVILCIRFTKYSNFVCARSMSKEEFQHMNYKYLNGLRLDYQCYCDNS